MAVRAEYESHCYVDDPGMAVAGGSAYSRKRSLFLVLLFLMCLGLDSSWMKAQLGKSIEWLGVIIKCTDIVAEIDDIPTDCGMTHEKKLRRVAGRVGWIAGSILWANSFASISYAVAHEDPDKVSARTAERRAKRQEHLRFATRPAEQALKWTRTLLQGNPRGAGGELLPLTRHVTLPGTSSGRLGIRRDAIQ